MRNLLSSLCYFSIFFAPFLFPVIVWIAVRDSYVQSHAKRALLSHFFPVLAVIPLLYSLVSQRPGLFVTFLLLFGIVYLVVFVYNIYKGIQSLREYA